MTHQKGNNFPRILIFILSNQKTSAALSTKSQQRLDQYLISLKDKGTQSHILDKIKEFITQSDDFDLESKEVRQLASDWHMESVKFSLRASMPLKVMAADATAFDAFNCGVEIQKIFSANGVENLKLRISICSGPVLAVQLNTAMDYFGATIKLAAKIQSCAGPGEIAMPFGEFKNLEKRLEKQFVFYLFVSIPETLRNLSMFVWFRPNRK